MKKVLVIGMGKVGSLVGLLLSKRFEVIGFDQHPSVYALPFRVIQGNIHLVEAWLPHLTAADAVVSCMPYNLNLNIAQQAHRLGKHYFDLTEDVPTTTAIRAMAAQGSQAVLVPQCGLAPGLIGIVGAALAHKFTRVRDIELRVGALPKYPNGLLGYSFTWSPAGVINEYLNDCEVIQNGQRKWVSALDGLETIHIEGKEFEAFSTSGGLGTMCETFEGKVDTLNYKSIRYPGHGKLMRFLLYELILKNKRTLVEEILTEAKPPVQEDVVYVYAIVEGWKGNQLAREEFYRAYSPKKIDSQVWRAISWTTAASVVAVVEMVADQKLAQQGFIKQEEIPFDDFKQCFTGKWLF